MARRKDCFSTPGSRVNMYEKGNNIVVDAELPAIKKENIDVRVEDHGLTCRGEHEEEKEPKNENYYQWSLFHPFPPYIATLVATKDNPAIRNSYRRSR